MKKGIAVSELAPIAIVIVTAGIAIGIGTAVLQSMYGQVTDKTTYTVQSITLNADSRKTVTALTSTYGIANTGIMTGLASMYNDTGTTPTGNVTMCSSCNLVEAACAIGSCNFTYNQTHVNTTLNGTGYPVTGWRFKYAWSNNNTDERQSFANSSFTMTTISQWMPTIGLVIAAAVIMGIAFAMVGRRDEGM
jgi:hypothetical protein